MVRMTLLAIVGGLIAAGAGVVKAHRTEAPRSDSFTGGLTRRTANAPYCSGDYADDFAALSAKTRDFEQKPQNQYTYCVRSTAIYECISYGADGNLRRSKKKTSAHGTAFAYKQQSGDTLLLTNFHVSDWPSVTDEDHHVEDVPQGCKRVSDSLRIVDNEADAYDRDDIPLSRAVTDPQMDVSVLKAHATLNVMPWKVGRSAALRERNVVDVRGFPLGAFKASSVGKVISAYDHDADKDWDHDDFVVDALLSPGNSGSPVLAVSCKTGEFELVGIFHAGYTGGSALNVVVGIDQLRGTMTTLKRSSRAAGKLEVSSMDLKARARLTEDSHSLLEPFFPFGNLPAVVRTRPDGALLFEVMSREFPLKSYPIMVVEDLVPSSPDEFGRLGRIWFGNRQGLKTFMRSDLDSDAQAQMTRLLDTLRHDALSAFEYRTASKSAANSREHFDQMSKLERALRRTSTAHADLSAVVMDLADRLGPRPNDMGTAVADIFTPQGVAGPPSVASGSPPANSAASAQVSPAGP